MNLKPLKELNPEQVKTGLNLVVKEGLFTEAMSTFTGGTLLMAMALHMGASHFQIGVLAALPTFSSVFQLIAIWLVQRFHNRRAIAVVCAFVARFPLFLVGILPFIFSASTSLTVMMFLLFFHYTFNSLVGASWNSWVKDLVPAEKLGSYFSHRSRLIQITNVTLSVLVALSIDYVKKFYPAQEFTVYAVMFVLGGTVGILGVYLLSRTPEPQSEVSVDNIFKLVKKPLKDRNFRKLLGFNASWAFALNMATPFFSVYMMKSMNLPLSYIIALGIVSQLSSILSIKAWGRYSDRYSNKTVLNICGPLYVLCLLSWTFTAMPSLGAGAMALLVVIHVFSGVATAGINLALSNIGMKLSSKQDSYVYIPVKNMVVAAISAVAPLLGGLLADFFSTRTLNWTIEWGSASGLTEISLLHLHHWNFFFIIGSVLAFFSLRLLKPVQEPGETAKQRVLAEMKMRAVGRLKTSVQMPYVIWTKWKPAFAKQQAVSGSAPQPGSLIQMEERKEKRA